LRREKRRTRLVYLHIRQPETAIHGHLHHAIVKSFIRWENTLDDETSGYRRYTLPSLAETAGVVTDILRTISTLRRQDKVDWDMGTTCQGNVADLAG